MTLVRSVSTGRRLLFQLGEQRRTGSSVERASRGHLNAIIRRLACIAAALVLWQALVATGVLTSSAVAEPTAIAQALGSLLSTWMFWASTGHTLRAWAIGLTVSLAVAVPIGLLLGASDLAYRLSRVTIDFLRTIPPVAVLPLALLLYGATERMVLLLVVFGSVWPLLLQCMYGVHQVDPVARDVARSYRLRRRDVVFRLILPSAAPFVATGIRIAATVSLLLVIGGELLGGVPGLGLSIALAQQTQQVPRMYAFVVVSALLGVAVNLGLLRLEGVILSWHSSHRVQGRP